MDCTRIKHDVQKISKNTQRLNTHTHTHIYIYIYIILYYITDITIKWTHGEKA